MVKLLHNINATLELQPPFYAGGLSRHLQQWQEITSDHNILSVIKGFHLVFTSQPYQGQWPSQLITSDSDIKVADNLLKDLMSKHVIEPTTPNQYGFMSNIFLRPKRAGGHRLILNLKPLNPHVEYMHFKMTTFASALELVSPNYYMASIDLSDAYYSVAVTPSHRKFLQFHFQ